ncbi:hypothetical protein E5C26_20235 [Serratia proteamaculans]|uniref:hypothetical protein n=1 Tax=Serratia proteamaculans TaxID=28151 RepID=UPI001076B1A3|nr:hypothetical protein [Serratia proteamaculans]TFZ48671.1 hypothetical protein E5C26_20235 [Serratia proteamaculans]
MPDMTISTAQAQQTPPSENTNSEQAGVSLPLTRSIINVSNRSLPNIRENALSNNTQLKMTEIPHDERLGHLPPSDKIVIDSSSFETFINMKEGNALAAIMRYNREESTVFLIPVKRDDTRAFGRELTIAVLRRFLVSQ